MKYINSERLLNKTKDIITFVIIIYCSMATFLTAESKLDRGFLLLIIFSIVYFFIKRERYIIPIELIYFFLSWFMINYFCTLFMSANLLVARVFHYFITLFLLPFVVLILVGESFWIRVEKILFILAKISLPLYLLNIIFENIFNKLGSVFHVLTYERLAHGSYWSAIFYVNAIRDYSNDILRNSGFMWEPGAFAMVIIIGVSLYWLFNGIRYDIHFFIYAIALITTLSTSGYLALFVLIIVKYVEKIKIFNLILLILFIVVFFVYVYQLDFVGGEINVYLEAYENKDFGYDAQNMAFKGNRFVGAFFDLMETFRYPFGYGVIKKSDYESGFDITGVSGLSNLLKMWGIPIFLYLMLLFWRFLNYCNLSKVKISVRGLLFIYIAILMMFFSNPIQRNTFMYLVFITPIVYTTKNLLMKKTD